MRRGIGARVLLLPAPPPPSWVMARTPPTTTTTNTVVTVPRYLSITRLIGAPKARNRIPTVRKISARPAMLARMNGTSDIPRKPAVIVSSLNGTGVAAAIITAATPYSSNVQRAAGRLSASPMADISGIPTASNRKYPMA